MDPMVFPVVGHSLTSDIRSLVDLPDFVLHQIRPASSTIPGVALAGDALEIHINCLRPIAMTTSTAILALMPLASVIGQGSAMQQPLAIAIISGLTVKLPLVLIVLPPLLAMWRTLSR